MKKPTYGHQCYSKALAAAQGYPVGDVRAPLTTFVELGSEGEARVQKVMAVIREMDAVVDKLEGGARPAGIAAE